MRKKKRRRAEHRERDPDGSRRGETSNWSRRAKDGGAAVAEPSAALEEYISTMPRPIAPAVRADSAGSFARGTGATPATCRGDGRGRRTDVLVSELMLQQTQVSRWSATTASSSSASRPSRTSPSAPARVIEAWEGLGYYARARNLHRLAQTVTDGGRSPRRGFRPTGGAPRAAGDRRVHRGRGGSFAYERRAALVDTNVARVLKRVFAPRSSEVPEGQRVVWRSRRVAAPANGSGDVDAQPGAHGAGRAGLHGARRPVLTLSGSLPVPVCGRETVNPADRRRTITFRTFLTQTELRREYL